MQAADAAELYVTDIARDVINGWPFLEKRQVGLVPHLKQLLWKHDEGLAWLKGCQGPAVKQELVNTVAVVKQQPLPASWKTHDDAVAPSLVQEVLRRFGGAEPVVDAFASKENKRFPTFWDVKVDAFTKDWKRSGLMWMNPPFDVVE